MAISCHFLLSKSRPFTSPILKGTFNLPIDLEKKIGVPLEVELCPIQDSLKIEKYSVHCSILMLMMIITFHDDNDAGAGAGYWVGAAQLDDHLSLLSTERWGAAMY